MVSRAILAIDPGSKLGWATDINGKLEWGTSDFTVRKGENSGARWARVTAWLEINSEGAGCIVYEKAHFPSVARYAADIAAGFTTRIEEVAEGRNLPLFVVSVQTLKAHAIPKVKRKKGDPKMDRSKEAMIRAAMARYGAKVSMGPPIFTEHEADALWLYWYAKEVLKA